MKTAITSKGIMSQRFFHVLFILLIGIIGANIFTACEGPEGPVGPAGEAGETPEISISDDGYWIIDGDTTDVKAKGEKGEDGVCIPCQNGSSSSVTPSSSSVGCPEYNPATHFCDERDYQIYGYKEMPDGKFWMTENLNYRNAAWEFNDIANETAVGTNGKGSWCYANNPDHCETYGRLYTWYAAMEGSEPTNEDPSEVQGACPNGWHLPSRAEWEVLIEEADGGDNDGKSLKATSGWASGYTNTSGTDDFGFAGLPGGARSESYNTFGSRGEQGYWWTTTMNIGNTSVYNSYLSRVDNTRDGRSAISIRCVRDEE